MYGFFQTAWFFGYTGLACFSLFCMMGTVGFISAERFIKVIYSNVKLD